MKQNLLKLALCAMALLPLGAWADGFGTEEVVSTTTTWIFNDYTTSATVSTCAKDATKPQTDKLYKRSATSGRGFTISEISSTNLTFTDGHEVSVTKYAQTTSNFNTNSVSTAGAVGNNATAAFAFNASVPGTVYVLMQESAGTHSSEYRQCIYFSTPSTDMTSKVRAKGKGALGIEEVSWTSTEAGSFYIGSNESSKIYAIRFVPSNVSVTIGAHGWASFSNNTSFGLAIPSGVTAYGASGKDGANIVLEPYTNVIPANTGVVLNGAAGTYKFDYTTVSGSYSGSNNYMTPVTADNTEIATDDYVLLWDNSASSVIFQKVTFSGKTLNAGKAYLAREVLATSAFTRAGTRSIGIDDDGTTGIQSMVNQNEGDHIFYTLQGVRVDNPTKGIYIKNGKKVIIK